jgi:hypothetical protein
MNKRFVARTGMNSSYSSQIFSKQRQQQGADDAQHCAVPVAVVLFDCGGRLRVMLENKEGNVHRTTPEWHGKEESKLFLLVAPEIV